MVTWTEITHVTTEGAFRQGVCLSSDTKPIDDVLNGSILMEMDTATLYLYDAENQTWRAWE